MAHAERLGVTRARMRTELRRGNWRLIARGAVLTRPEPPTRADWAELGVALAGPSAALSGWDAMRVRGLGSVRPPSDEVVVLSQHASNRLIGNVRIRETRRPYAIQTAPVWAGYPLTPVTSVARAVSDASRYYRQLSPVRSAVTGAVQRRLCTVEELIAELDAGPRQHSHWYREALGDAMDGARSEAEATAARRLRRASLPAFELNVPIVDLTGAVIAVADVLWRALRAIVEIEGREYHLGETEWKRTMARHNRLARLGLTVTHYPPSAIGGGATAWLDEIETWLRARSREVGVPWSPSSSPARRSGRGSAAPEPYRCG